MQSPSPHRVIVIGGGAGGLELAVRLGRAFKNSRRAEVTLVDRNLTHLWKPLLHEVAAGTLDSSVEAVDYLALAHRHGFRFRPGTLIGVDREMKQVRLAAVVDSDGRNVIPPDTLRYDTLLLAVGSRSNDFNTPGVRENCFFLDSRHQADRFHETLLNRFLELQFGSRDGAAPAQPLTVAIVGGGATGVELAAELHHVGEKLKGFGFDHLAAGAPIRLTLIESAPRILQALPERVSRAAERQLRRMNIEVLTSCRALEVNPEAIRIDSGQAIRAALKVWTAGIKAPDLLSALDRLETNPLHQLLVNPDLTTTRDPNIFALGDCAACPLPGGHQTVPPRAQAAHQQAALLAKSIVRRIDGKPPLPFVYTDYGSLVSMSRSSAGTLMGNLAGSFFVEGWLARIIYLSLYRSHQLVLHGPRRTLLLMMMSLLTGRTQPRLKLH